ATWHALRVAEMSRRRAIAAFAAGVAQVAATSLDADEMHAEIQRRFETLDNTSTDEGPKHWSAIITEGMEAIEQAASGEAERGLPTGLHDLDRAIGGLKPGDVTIIGGRPGSGKSTLAMQIASHVALDLALPVLTFSLRCAVPSCTTGSSPPDCRSPSTSSGRARSVTTNGRSSPAKRGTQRTRRCGSRTTRTRRSRQSGPRPANGSAATDSGSSSSTTCN